MGRALKRARSICLSMAMLRVAGCEENFIAASIFAAIFACSILNLYNPNL